MEKSIESIWKEGFINADALIAPKVNDLYNKKSINIIDKMMRMIKINNLVLILFAFSFLVYAIFAGIPIALNILLSILLAAPAIYSKIQLNKVENIERTENSYQYIKQFDARLKKQISRNITLSRFFYPTCVLGASLIIWFSEGREEVIEKLLVKYPDLILIAGVPLYFIIGILLISVTISVFAGKIYKWDVGIVYGRVFKKLQELIADLEELRE